MSLENNLLELERRIREACSRAGRNRSEVELVAISKSHPPETIREAMRAGIFRFGENKVQEARAKIAEVGGATRWDLVGHLQTNKAREAVRLFDLIHSVDSLRLAEALEKEAAQAGKTQRILLEANVSGEGSKYGFQPAELAGALTAINALPHLAVEGLMTLAPYSEDPEKARPHFRRLREWRDELAAQTGTLLPCLSMGMSGDFEPAIEQGATLIRIGTALFGRRQKPPHD